LAIVSGSDDSAAGAEKSFDEEVLECIEVLDLVKDEGWEEGKGMWPQEPDVKHVVVVKDREFVAECEAVRLGKDLARREEDIGGSGDIELVREGFPRGGFVWEKGRGTSGCEAEGLSGSDEGHCGGEVGLVEVGVGVEEVLG
jgi:hypothetical protein